PRAASCADGTPRRRGAAPPSPRGSGSIRRRPASAEPTGPTSPSPPAKAAGHALHALVASLATVVTVAAGDGNGWVECRCGSRHWGRHGAAGLLLLRPVLGVDLKPGQDAEVLLQLRAAWTHEGGSWGLVGGARDSHEDVVAAALREAAEEAGLRPDALRVVGHQVGVDHG